MRLNLEVHDRISIARVDINTQLKPAIRHSTEIWIRKSIIADDFTWDQLRRSCGFVAKSYKSLTDSVGVTFEDFVGQRFLNDKSLVFTRDSYGVGSYNQRCYKHGAALQPASQFSTKIAVDFINCCCSGNRRFLSMSHRIRYSLMHDLSSTFNIQHSKFNIQHSTQSIHENLIQKDISPVAFAGMPFG